MYYVSNLINNSTDYGNDHEIHIIDGQNETQIKQYKQMNQTHSKWNPCIPATFNDDKSITLTFNGQNCRHFITGVFLKFQVIPG